VSEWKYHQPTVAGDGLAASRPSTQLGWAIAAVVTFWPLAIPAFVYSFRVDEAWRAGDWDGAFSASRSARTCGLVAVVVGAVSWLAMLVVMFAMWSGPSFPAP
jgi:hypothetical protein